MSDFTQEDAELIELVIDTIQLAITRLEKLANTIPNLFDFNELLTAQSIMHKAASILFNFYNENFKIREDFVLRKAIKSFIDKMSKEQIKAINEFVENMEVDNE